MQIPSTVDARRFAELAGALTLRSLKVRYRGSILGVYWSLLNPVIMTIVYATIFGQVFQRYYEGSALRYAVAVFVALIAVNFVIGSTTAALPSLVNNGMLLNKIKLPMAAFPVSVILAHCVQLVAANVPALLLITVLVSRNPYHVPLLLIPLAGAFLLSIGIAFAVSTLYVFFRDIPYLYELLTFLLWLTSPVFYPVAIVPEQVRAYLWINPLFPVIESLRQLAMNAAGIDLRLLGLSILQGVVVCAAGWLVFSSFRARFMDYV